MHVQSRVRIYKYAHYLEMYNDNFDFLALLDENMSESKHGICKGRNYVGCSNKLLRFRVR